MVIDTGLSGRYEIRVLDEKHIPCAAAIIIHSNIFYSPIWPVIFPDNKTRRANDGMKAVDYMVRHQIESGYSLGVFDTEYKYKRVESAATEGKLTWDLDDDTAEPERLLDEMDFPLVSIALAYDSIRPFDMDKIAPVIAVLPPFGTLHHVLVEKDTRDLGSWQATAPGEVLFSSATSTRREYEGQGLMAALARYMMRWAAARGFRGIQIECAADAVHRVWMNPPAPFAGELVSEFHTTTYKEQDEKGEVVNPFYPSKQRLTKVFCHLK